MRVSMRQPLSDGAEAKRLQHLTAAFAAFRRVSRPGRRIPLGLRRQVVAALDAGVSVGAIARACGVAWSQATRWRLVEHTGRVSESAPQAQVLAVVDASVPAPASSVEGVELRVGFWRISVSRLAD
jgi:transposase-like protein